jgi:hypothetical protein
MSARKLRAIAYDDDGKVVSASKSKLIAAPPPREGTPTPSKGRIGFQQDALVVFTNENEATPDKSPKKTVAKKSAALKRIPSGKSLVVKKAAATAKKTAHAEAPVLKRTNSSYAIKREEGAAPSPPKKKVVKRSAAKKTVVSKKTAASKAALPTQKRHKAHRTINFERDVFRINREINANGTFAKSGYDVMNDLVMDLLSRISRESDRMRSVSGAATLNEADVLASLDMILPEHLRKSTVAHVNKALAKYNASYPS